MAQNTQQEEVAGPAATGTPQALTVPDSVTGTEEQVTQISSLLMSLEEAAEVSGQTDGIADTPDARFERELIQGRLGMAASLLTALRFRHAPTASHCVRVALGCSSWAATLKMPDELRTQLELAAILHDIGKIGIPDNVLLKPSRLSADEMEIIDRHVDMAREILSRAGAPSEIFELVNASAAWFDGSHYRVALAGDQIPLISRMLSIVDAFDSMTTDHVYRRAKSRERAIAELFEYAGRQFDPGLVRSFSDHFSADQVELRKEVASRWLMSVVSREGGLPWTPTSTTSLTPPVGSSTHSALQAGTALFENKLIEHMQDGVIFVDRQRKISQWNTGVERLTGVSASAALGQQLLPSLLEMSDKKGKTIPDAACPVEKVLESGMQSMGRYSILGRSGRHIEVDVQIAPVQSGSGTTVGATLLFHDASSEASLEEKCQTLHVEMTKDPMTQVANRAEFDRMLEIFIDAHQQTALPCSLIMCDIDHFKNINDTYGHQAGDEAIISFASLLKSLCRAGDLVARYGGEEFAVLCADCNNAAAYQRAEQMRRQLAELPHSELGNKNITASFGVTELQAGDIPETMLRRADRGLLQAKEQGRNQVVQLGDGMIDEAPKKSWWPFAIFRGDALLETELVTNVPIEIAVEKLRGFIADHNAKILKTAKDEIRLETDDSKSVKRRDGDRAVSFVIDIKLAEERIERNNSSGLAAGSYVHTKLSVTIRPRRDRDRRRNAATQRARLLLGSLKSYLIAKESMAEAPVTP